MITVYFINGSGGGFVSTVAVEQGTMLEGFVAQHLNEVGGGPASNYKIKVNREHQQGSYVLQNGDRVTVTPTKIEGA